MLNSWAAMPVAVQCVPVDEHDDVVAIVDAQHGLVGAATDLQGAVLFSQRMTITG